MDPSGGEYSAAPNQQGDIGSTAFTPSGVHGTAPESEGFSAIPAAMIAFLIKKMFLLCQSNLSISIVCILIIVMAMYET